MKVYWKVHINNFDGFVEYILAKYKNFNNTPSIFEKYYYDTVNLRLIKKEYLYFYINNIDESLDYYSLTYSDYDTREREWREDWMYMGEFMNRKYKLDHLKIISDEGR